MKIIIDEEASDFTQNDVIDLGEQGIILWLSGPQSEAYRLIQNERREEINKTIDFSLKHRKELEEEIADLKYKMGRMME